MTHYHDRFLSILLRSNICDVINFKLGNSLECAFICKLNWIGERERRTADSKSTIFFFFNFYFCDLKRFTVLKMWFFFLFRWLQRAKFAHNLFVNIHDDDDESSCNCTFFFFSKLEWLCRILYVAHLEHLYYTDLVRKMEKHHRVL